MIKTTLFQIDGRPMYAPDEGVGISWQDIDAADSGRDQAGNMHRVVIKYDLGTWRFQYFSVTEEELAYMKTLFSGKATFQFTHPDPYDRDSPVTVQAYRTGHSISWKNAQTGKFKNYSFSIVECGEEAAYV